MTAWQDAKRVFNMSVDDKEKLYKDHRDLTFHKYGNKAGKLLSYLTKERFDPIRINRLQQPDGTITTDPKTINTLFKHYYETLYATQPYDLDRATAFLDSVCSPQITKEQHNTLNAPITIKEITDTLQRLPKAKRRDQMGTLQISTKQ